MSVRSKNIWKAHFIFNFVFFLLALIGLWKTHTLWGFVLPAASVGMTAILAWFVDKQEAGKKDD
ncbi:hypothetical protein CR152_29260 [Massilia violaceinigra]|uniref:2TM domain-containing protein n=1 Tax=Massilia violaceinigra TaxID=2045208 RepID=A0A2D2DT59_9BURK|nr:hypothetical protein [Massilia violaceinigra]ATQ78146.1 hypothetical protein CR152_29260 [Massilia violaceinigra]